MPLFKKKIFAIWVCSSMISGVTYSLIILYFLNWYLVNRASVPLLEMVINNETLFI